LELCEISLLVEVGNHSFQLGEGSWFSLLAVRSRKICGNTRVLFSSYNYILIIIYIAFSIFARFGSLLSCSFIWAFRPQVLFLRFAVDNLDFLILLFT